MSAPKLSCRRFLRKLALAIRRADNGYLNARSRLEPPVGFAGGPDSTLSGPWPVAKADLQRLHSGRGPYPPVA